MPPEATLSDLVDRIVPRVTARAGALPTARRLLVAVAGPPASGKSTLAEALADRLPNAVAVPMDGFHLDNAILAARGLLPRKGAPESFDAAGFVATVRRLTSEDEVILPAFDRSRDIAIAGRIAVGAADRIAVIEGNYLCLNASPWSDLQPLWDLSVYLDVPEATLHARLVQRWRDHGLDAQAARARAEANDLPNARRIAQGTTQVDLRLTTP